MVLTDCTEALKRLDIQSGFFAHLTHSGLPLVFVYLHMPLGKSPIVTLAVFDQQVFEIPAVPTEDHRTAGFFKKTGNAAG